MATEFDKKFNKHTKLTKKKDHWECECKKDLWGVSGPTKKKVKDEGRHYFQQYLSDGEYNDYPPPPHTEAEAEKIRQLNASRQTSQSQKKLRARREIEARREAKELGISYEDTLGDDDG